MGARVEFRCQEEPGFFSDPSPAQSGACRCAVGAAQPPLPEQADPVGPQTLVWRPQREAPEFRPGPAKVPAWSKEPLGFLRRRWLQQLELPQTPYFKSFSSS